MQLHRSSSPPSIPRCQSMTDIPRDVTSTSPPLCPLFTCKSVAHALNTRQNTADGTRERTSFSRIRCIAALLVAISRSSSRTSFRLWAWSILLVGCWVPFFAF